MPHEGGTIPSDLTDPAVNPNTGEFDQGVFSEVGRLFDPNQMTQFEADLGLVGTEEGMPTVEEQRRSSDPAEIVRFLDPTRATETEEHTNTYILGTAESREQTLGVPNVGDVGSGLQKVAIVLFVGLAALIGLNAFARGAGEGAVS